MLPDAELLTRMFLKSRKVQCALLRIPFLIQYNINILCTAAHAAEGVFAVFLSFFYLYSLLRFFTAAAENNKHY